MTKLHCPTCGFEIDEHEAGPCLDAWAATDVMKWKWNDSLGWGNRPYWTDKTETEEGPACDDWSPSTDIAAAWMLVEKLDADGWAINILYYEKSAEVYFCREIPRTAGAGWVIAEPKCPGPLSLSITRAAIKAKSE